ncbi:MAG: phosphoribosyltransferase [Pseudanabaenaceae cyanobacterium]
MTSPRLEIDWATYHNLLLELAQQIYESCWEFDSILCLARGGLRVGDTLSRLLRKPLAVLSTSSYTDNHQRGKLKIADCITHTAPLGDRLLVADDMVDSGVTLIEVLHWLDDRYQFQEVRTAVLWYKARSICVPDYYVSYLPENPWIVQPFEEFEHMAERFTLRDI